MGDTLDLTREKDGGVLKKLLTKGKNWRRPETGDEVFGALISSLKSHPHGFPLACVLLAAPELAPKPF